MTRRGDKARKSRDVSRNTNGPETVKARAPWRIGTLTRPLRRERRLKTPAPIGSLVAQE
jgi:hypothetical protein